MTMRSAPFAGTLVALACVALAGCGANKMSADTSVPSDARIRHPIALTDAPYSTDVFPSGGSGALDRRTADQISDFAERYRTIGHGPITVLVPTGGANDAAMSHSVTAMRHALAQSARAPVSVVPYPVADPALAAPVRLSFEGLKAKVSHRCGDWPSDLASGSTTRGWDNKTYWNFGCANQNMLAAQVADPRDLAGPRGETPSDVAMRMRAINSVRKAEDPGTNWKTTNSQIGTVGQ